MHDMDSDSEPEDDTPLSQADTQQVQPALTPMEIPADIEDPALASFIVSAVLAEGRPIFFHKSEAS